MKYLVIDLFDSNINPQYPIKVWGEKKNNFVESYCRKNTSCDLFEI